MKFPISGLIPFLLLTAAQAVAVEPYRMFTDAEGREIKARIYNTDGQTVLLETEDGQGFKTTIDVFSLDDQDYIRRWEPSLPEQAEGPELDESEAEIREEIYYRIGEDVPFSGTLVSKFIDDTPKATVALSYGVQHGPTTIWHDTGGKQLRAMYRNGAQHGLTTLWYADGQLKTESAYAYGTQHGLTTFWHSNGNKRSEGLWSQGQREGVHTKWDENGQMVSEIAYTLGRPNGEGAAWHNDGQKKMAGTWTNGVKDGLYTEWYDDGQPKMEVNYVDGVVTGKPLYWSRDGKRLKHKPVEDTPLAQSSDTDPSPAFAGPKVRAAKSGGKGNYVRYLGRISIPKDTIWSSTLKSTGAKFDQTVELEGGFALGGALGRDFGLYRAELEGTYSTYEPTGITYNLPNGGYSKGSATGDIVQYGLLFNNAIDLEVTPNMEIFGGAGIGLTYTSLDLQRGSASTQSATGVKFAYQLLTGLKYNLSGYHNLTGGYKYLSNGDVGDFEGIKTHNFEFGYRLDM